MAAVLAIPAQPLPLRAEQPSSHARRSRQLSLKTPHLSVVLVNFCQWRNTARLTRQLRNSEAFRTDSAEVVIVDNHSPAHPLRGQLRRALSVSVRRMSRNGGFARAVNEGGRLSQGEWLLLLNPDMSVRPGFLDEVERVTRQLSAEDTKAGIVGFRLMHTDGSPQASCGPWPTLTRTLVGLCLPRAVRKCRVLTVENRVRVPWVTGCCLLIHRDCLQDLGGLDERFFLYYEDVDLCLRATERGWNVYFEPTLEVVHHTPLHTREVPAPLRLMTRHALLTYGRKHWPRWQTWLLGGLIWAEAGVRQFRAWWRGDRNATRIHGELRRLVGDVLGSDEEAVRQCIRRTAQHLEQAAAAQDCKADME